MIVTFLQVVFIVFVAVNVFMRFKPLIAGGMFIRDLFKLDRHIFRGYGFWLYCGLGGSGKTLSMVEYLSRMKKKYPKVKIYTNFTCAVSDGKIERWEDILEIDNVVDGVNYGVIFGFDEIHLTFASQNWKNCPDNFLEYISQQRKLHKQIVASSQVFTRIDKKLREQTNFVIECKSVLMGRWTFQKFFHTEEYLANGELKDKGAHKRVRARHYNFISYDTIRNLYDTGEIMKEIKVGKSKDVQALDSLRELVNYSDN